MSLLVQNITGVPITLAIANGPVVSSSTNPPSPGLALNVTSECRPDLTVDPAAGHVGGLTALDFSALAAQTGLVFKWTGPVEYLTDVLVPLSSGSDLPEYVGKAGGVGEAGEAVSITGGAGGDVPFAPPGANVGFGGNVTLAGGAGGSGVGGSGGNPGDGGGVFMQGGNGGVGGVNQGAGTGGQVRFTAGNGGDSGGPIWGPGGANSVIFLGGNGGAGDAVNAGSPGGNVSMIGGNAGFNNGGGSASGGGVALLTGYGDVLGGFISLDGQASGSRRATIAIGEIQTKEIRIATGGVEPVIVTIGHPTAPPTFPGGAQLTTTAARPAAAEAQRGKFWVVLGEPGVADAIFVCLKSAANTYSWVQVATG